MAVWLLFAPMLGIVGVAAAEQPDPRIAVDAKRWGIELPDTFKYNSDHGRTVGTNVLRELHFGSVPLVANSSYVVSYRQATPPTSLILTHLEASVSDAKDVEASLRLEAEVVRSGFVALQNAKTPMRVAVESMGPSADGKSYEVHLQWMALDTGIWSIQRAILARDKDHLWVSSAECLVADGEGAAAQEACKNFVQALRSPRGNNGMPIQLPKDAPQVAPTGDATDPAMQLPDESLQESMKRNGQMAAMPVPGASPFSWSMLLGAFLLCCAIAYWLFKPSK